MKTVVFQAFAALLLAIVLPLHAEKVRVGFYLEDGFCGFDVKGERTGVCVDWAAAVAPINGWDVEWVNCSWSSQNLTSLNIFLVNSTKKNTNIVSCLSIIKSFTEHFKSCNN